MELVINNPKPSNGVITIEEPTTKQISTEKPFIQANTEEVTLEEVRDNHIIPVFIKDNEPLISHVDFVESTLKVASQIYSDEIILQPSIRVSHPIKGRIPEAKNKPASELEEWEKTVYFERMAFIIEIPSIHDVVSGNTLSLTIGGVKAYNLDNLYSKKGADEHFKIFIGFQNKVCTNLCVFSDGLMTDIRVSSVGQLISAIRVLIENYNAIYHLDTLKRFSDYSITEAQFAQIIGKCRMYNSLPASLKQDITPLQFGDNQIGALVRDYYKDESFCRDEEGNINLWKLYNLFTGVNKSSYIDNYLEKASNAFQFVENIKWALEKSSNNWYLS